MFQLLPSIFAQTYPRQFLQRVPAIYATVSASLFIESLGVLHATFLIVDILEKILPTQSAWERGRYVHCIYVCACVHMRMTNCTYPNHPYPNAYCTATSFSLLLLAVSQQRRLRLLPVEVFQRVWLGFHGCR